MDHASPRPLFSLARLSKIISCFFFIFSLLLMVDGTSIEASGLEASFFPYNGFICISRHFRRDGDGSVHTPETLLKGTISQ